MFLFKGIRGGVRKASSLCLSNPSSALLVTYFYAKKKAFSDIRCGSQRQYPQRCQRGEDIARSGARGKDDQASQEGNMRLRPKALAS